MRQFLLSALCLIVPSVARAELSIIVGNHVLLANTPGQEIKIFVSGGDPVQGVNFIARIGDGGPELGGVLVGPSISGIDLITNTIFEANNTGVVDPEADFGASFKQIELRSTTTNTASVVGDGLLATLLIDTTGFSEGVFPLILSDPDNRPSDFAGVSARIADGTITVVPETASVVLVGLGVSVVMAGAFRRRIGGPVADVAT